MPVYHTVPLITTEKIRKKIQICKYVICLPTEHQGVHKNSFWNVRAFQHRIRIWKCWFLRKGENRSIRRKISLSREVNQQKTHPTYEAGSGNRTRNTLMEGERSHHCAIPAIPTPTTTPSLVKTLLGCVRGHEPVLVLEWVSDASVSSGSPSSALYKI